MRWGFQRKLIEVSHVIRIPRAHAAEASMLNTYTEPASSAASHELFAEIGWTVLSASEETFGATGTLLREQVDVVLTSRLRTALEG